MSGDESALGSYRQTVLATWREQSDGRRLPLVGFDRMPLFARGPSEARPLDVLFIGANPSYRFNVLRKHWRESFGTEYPQDRAPLAWRPGRTGEELIQVASELECLDAHSRRMYEHYYARVDALAKEAAEGCYSHVFDLFPIRASLQAELGLQHGKGVPLHPALTELLEGFLTLVAAWRPQLVVVLNGGASN